MDSTELENRLRALAYEAKDGHIDHIDVSTCLLTVAGALAAGKVDELSDVMVQFTVVTVGELVKDDVVKREQFKAILRDSLMESMEQK